MQVRGALFLRPACACLWLCVARAYAVIFLRAQLLGCHNFDHPLCCALYVAVGAPAPLASELGILDVVSRIYAVISCVLQCALLLLQFVACVRRGRGVCMYDWASRGLNEQ